MHLFSRVLYMHSDFVSPKLSTVAGNARVFSANSIANTNTRTQYCFFSLPPFFYTQCGARIQDPETESHMLMRLSQPGTPEYCSLKK